MLVSEKEVYKFFCQNEPLPPIADVLDTFITKYSEYSQCVDVDRGSQVAGKMIYKWKVVFSGYVVKLYIMLSESKKYINNWLSCIVATFCLSLLLPVPHWPNKHSSHCCAGWSTASFFI